MKTVLSLLVLLLSCLFVYSDKSESDVSIVDADETEDDFQEDPDFISSSEDIETSYVFPDYQEKKFPLGEIIDILLGIKNNGEKTYNVTILHGLLHYNQEFVIQNFTQFFYGSLVEKNDHTTYLYRFLPDPRLEPREYGVVISADYIDNEGTQYSSIVANTTITLYEPDAGYDILSIVTTIAFAVAGFGALYFFTGGFKTKKFSKRSSTKVEMGTSSDDSLLAGSNFSRKKKQE